MNHHHIGFFMLTRTEQAGGLAVEEQVMRLLGDALPRGPLETLVFGGFTEDEEVIRAAVGRALAIAALPALPVLLPPPNQTTPVGWTLISVAGDGTTTPALKIVPAQDKGDVLIPLAAPPFSYSLFIKNAGATIESRRDYTLKLPAYPLLVDTHAHTEFAYCCTTSSVSDDLNRAALFGLAGLGVAEHSPQLYCSAEDYWQGQHIYNPKIWRQTQQNRMPAFRKCLDSLSIPGLGRGLEVELDRDGELIIHDCDREWADYLVGAVHWLSRPMENLSETEIKNQFLADTRRLLEQGVNILAHPWRFFRRSKRDIPRDLYPELADMLATFGVAAEINYHTNDPDPVFFSQCIDRGVPIALGSDCHAIEEAGAFGPHFRLLEKAAGGRDLAPLLFRPPFPLAN